MQIYQIRTFISKSTTRKRSGKIFRAISKRTLPTTQLRKLVVAIESESDHCFNLIFNYPSKKPVFPFISMQHDKRKMSKKRRTKERKKEKKRSHNKRNKNNKNEKQKRKMKTKVSIFMLVGHSVVPLWCCCCCCCSCHIYIEETWQAIEEENNRPRDRPRQ